MNSAAGRFWHLVVWHQIADLMRIIGLRDRLRCPECAAVGTWKPHGGWLDGRESRFARRWMCKWCGHYRGPQGIQRVFPSPERGCWMLESAVGPDLPLRPTPRAVLEASAIPKVRPWFG